MHSLSNNVIDRKNRTLQFVSKKCPLLTRQCTKWIWNKQFEHMRKCCFETSVVRSNSGWNFYHRDQHLGFAVHPQQFLKSAILKERILICGSGPSIHEYDWSNCDLTQTTIVALNGSNIVLNELSIIPDIHFITDKNFLLSNKASIQLSLAKNTTFVVSPAAASYLFNNPQLNAQHTVCVVELVNSWYGTPKKTAISLPNGCHQDLLFNQASQPRYMDKTGWSTNPQLGVFSGATVAYSALQFFDFAGKKCIELLGIDLTGKTRAYKENNPQPSQLDRDFENIIKPAFTFMGTINKKTKSIRNLSQKCSLPESCYTNPS